MATLANLLPHTHHSLRHHIGDGIPPVPDKIAVKIRKGEFIEMGELLPEFWSPRGDDNESSRENKSRKSRKVTDIFTWLQCFGAYVSVRAPPAPHLIPELMAYMATIVRVSQDFSGLAWVRYDTAFRRQAALARNDRWSIINSTLYTMCFTGLASSTTRCELCFASSHTEQERGDPDPGMKDRLKALETAVLAFTSKQDTTGKPMQPPVKTSGEPCRIAWDARSLAATTRTYAVPAGGTTRPRSATFAPLTPFPQPGNRARQEAILTSKQASVTCSVSSCCTASLKPRTT